MKIKDPKNSYGFATKEEVLEIAKAVQSLAKEMERLRQEVSRPVRKVKRNNSGVPTPISSSNI